VHDIVCEFVAAQARAETEASGGWAGYRKVFLSAEVQDLIRSRLAGAAAAASPPEEPEGGAAAGSSIDGARSPKKLEADTAPAAPSAPAVDDEVSWTVCCLDGATFSVAVPDDTRVAEMKRAIGALHEVPHYAMELFVEGEEDPLDDEKRLMSAEKVPLFMVPKAASDRLALEALFWSCGGAGWRKKGGWMTNADLGEWFGVTVDAEGRVIKLKLYSNNLSGPLPSELQQLSTLHVLILNNNKLTGRIPAELGQLQALTVLNLANNQLSGPIPAELRQLGGLQVLYLQGNQQLSGQQALNLHMREHNPECTFRTLNLHMREHNPECTLRT
jgi:hypothetical protein